MLSGIPERPEAVRQRQAPTTTEVGGDAGLGGLGHVAHGGQAVAGSSEEGHGQQPLHPAVDPPAQAAPQRLGCGDAGGVEHHQRLHEQAAEGQVARLQIHVCKSQKREAFQGRDTGTQIQPHHWTLSGESLFLVTHPWAGKTRPLTSISVEYSKTQISPELTAGQRNLKTVLALKMRSGNLPTQSWVSGQIISLRYTSTPL